MQSCSVYSLGTRQISIREYADLELLFFNEVILGISYDVLLHIHALISMIA